MLPPSWAKMYGRAKKDGARASVCGVPKLQGDGIKCGRAESWLVSGVAQRQVVGCRVARYLSGLYDDLRCHVRRSGVLAFCQRDASVFCNR
jgi:hypothetical protein